MSKLIPVKGGFVGDYEYEVKEMNETVQDTSDISTIILNKGEKPVKYRIPKPPKDLENN
jgi:hypothetical protein